MYDFKTIVDRRNLGSSKYNLMLENNPDIEKDVIPLSVADADFPIMPEIKEGLKKYLDEAVLGYAAPTEKYFDSIIKWMKKIHDYEIKKEWIVPIAGVVNGVMASIIAYTEENDGVIIMEPVYYPFKNSILNTNRKPVICELKKDENNYYTIDCEKLEELAKDEKNKLLVLCSPHNPVGRVWTKEELQKIGEIAKRNNLIITSDEIWCDIVMPGYKHHMLHTVDDTFKDISIIATAPSKTFNIAGMATSNMIIPNETLKEKFLNAMIKMNATHINILGFKACELAYNNGEKYLAEFIELIDNNQKIMKDELEKIDGIKIRNIEGTYLQWVDFNYLNLENIDLETFMQKEAKLFLDEGYIFGESGSGFERFNIACPTEILIKHLERLKDALKKRV